MKSRFALIVVAVILAFVATTGSAIYLQSLKANITQGNEMVEVLTAEQAISPGVTVEEMLNKNMLSSTTIPRRYLVKGAVTSAQGLGRETLVVYMSKGEQLTTQKLAQSGGGGLSSKVPKDFVAVSIPVDEVSGVGDQVSAGDKVSLIGTFSPGPGGPDASRVLINNVEVLATSNETVGSDKKGIGNGGGLTKKTITVAVSPANGERLVFAAEKGHIWVMLQSVGDKDQAPTTGTNIDSVFR